MSFEITVPSKTFLLGEYLALKEGPAIILSTEPRFKLVAITHAHSKIDTKEFHHESPAGKLIKQDPNFYQHYQIQFIDPYHGLGGFGASSAQFVMLTALKNTVNSSKIDDFNLLDNYIKLAWHGQGTPPSGADLIAQLHGGICFFHKSEKNLQIYSWPFLDLEYCLIHTGNKLATHDHLKQTINFNASELEKIVQTGLASLKQSDSKRFVEAIHNYATTLESQNLTAAQTQKILNQLALCPDILAAKGCGAMGADVIFIVFNKSRQKHVISWLKEKNLHIITYGHTVANGLDIREINL